MSDYIRIVDQQITSFIGVPDEERREAQRLLVTVELKVPPFTTAAMMDNVSLTVNYYDVSQTIHTVAAQRPRKLIETLAEDMATAILRNYRVEEVTIEIMKFILPDTKFVAVKLTRGGA